MHTISKPQIRKRLGKWEVRLGKYFMHNFPATKHASKLNGG